MRNKRTQWALTKEEMKNCVWLKPELVVQIEFAEWTPDGHLRHSKFVGLREDKDPGEVTCKQYHRARLGECCDVRICLPGINQIGGYSLILSIDFTDEQIDFRARVRFESVQMSFF